MCGICFVCFCVHSVCMCMCDCQWRVVCIHVAVVLFLLCNPPFVEYCAACMCITNSVTVHTVFSQRTQCVVMCLGVHAAVLLRPPPSVAVVSVKTPCLGQPCVDQSLAHFHAGNHIDNHTQQQQQQQKRNTHIRATKYTLQAPHRCQHHISNTHPANHHPPNTTAPPACLPHTCAAPPAARPAPPPPPPSTLPCTAHSAAPTCAQRAPPSCAQAPAGPAQGRRGPPRPAPAPPAPPHHMPQGVPGAHCPAVGARFLVLRGPPGGPRCWQSSPSPGW